MTNETAQSVVNSDFPGGRAAVGLGVALLLGLGIVLALVLRDNANHSSLETIRESTAVGDTRYFSVPDPLPSEPYPVAVRVNGQAYSPAGYRRHEKRETEMESVAKDEATGLTIYQAPVKAKDAGEPPTFFLKAGPGEFIKLRAASSTP